MRCVDTVNAVGHVLCYDITMIIKDVKKGVAFKKGHVVREEDIPELLKLGKERLYVWEKDENMLHEDEAAEILRDVCMGENMRATSPKEDKIDLIATRHGCTPVKENDVLAGTRVILRPKWRVCGRPRGQKRCGIVTTGSKMFYGRIADTFTPVIEEKIAEYGMTVIGHDPLYHPLMLSKCAVDFRVNEEHGEIEAICTASLTGKMGVEVEALTGVSVALLTIYDMCKAIDKRIEITDIYLAKKTGGKSGGVKHAGRIGVQAKEAGECGWIFQDLTGAAWI